jgi:cell division protein FtsQ
MRFLSRRPAATPSPRPRRRQRLRRRPLLIGTAGVFALILLGGGWWLERSGAVARATDALHTRIADAAARAGLAVESVEVEGRHRAGRAAILSALGVHRGTPMLAVDPATAKARLEALPWVRSAAVERRLPDTLYVRLVERRPLAFWQRNGKLALVDREGEVIPTERLDGFGPLIVLVGDDAPGLGAQLVDMLASEPALAPHVTAAVRVGGRRWNLRLDSGIDVALPEEQPAEAWHRLAALDRKDRLLERNIEEVDLRLPDRLVVRVAAEPPKAPSKKGRHPGKST